MKPNRVKSEPGDACYQTSGAVIELCIARTETVAPGAMYLFVDRGRCTVIPGPCNLVVTACVTYVKPTPWEF